MSNNLKFNLDYLPIGAHYNNLRNIFNPKIWKLVVENVRESKNYQCEFCHRKFDKSNSNSLRYLHCHEYWIFNYELRRQKLLDILLLCNNCHNTQHINLSSLKEWDEKVINHYIKTNKLTIADFNKLKRENYLFRKNYDDNSIVTRKEMDEIEFWFFKNELRISKYFKDKEIGIEIEKFLDHISSMNA